MTEITTEKAIDFLKRYDNDEVYTPLCVNSHKLAIKALEENEGLKAQIKEYEHDIRVLGARTEVLLVANKAVNEKIQKAREEIEASATEADFADYNNLSCGEETSTETARCEAEDISMGVKLDDVRAIFDKYLGEVKDDKSDRNK